MGKLEQSFLDELLIGELVGLLWKVQHDDTLDIEIQGNNCINVYYRGSSMFMVEQLDNSFNFKFDYNYCNHKYVTSEFLSIFIKNFTTRDWIESIPYIKSEMDLWLYENRTHQKEFLQVIVRDNNYSNTSLYTDYFISDMEYKINNKEFSFDLLSLRCKDNSLVKEGSKLFVPAIMNFYYGNQEIITATQVIESFRRISDIFSNERLVSKIYSDAESKFNQKVKLGLIRGINNTVNIDRSVKPELILLFANHKPSFTELKEELKKAYLIDSNISTFVDVKIGSASNYGYGLYADNMHSIEDFIG